MDVSSRALWRKSYLLPSVLCSHCSGIEPFRWVTKRTVRMASLSSSAAQSAAIPDAAASSSAATHGASSSSAATDAAASSSSFEASASSAIDFLSLCHRLKTTKRAGWVRKGVREPESVADHMYRMSVMALIADYSPDIDRERCIKMALVHDIAEAIVGDITPSDGVPKDEKSRREREAINHMCNLLGGGSRAKEMLDLWMEYEENSSLEAKVVKDFDKVEMILQALEYEQEQGMILDEFFQSTAGKFQTDVGKAWALEITSRRKKQE
ncbi:hypothetical protein KFK09_023342 [Dendrobium nobile]|uniref:5'-deoxynucleotidase n=1 Tax=Dendrobium nobile TaxID=94219 RepID=A0A8T3ALV9_DENNO|nr:hypothetical protein KFK09_023342 [Dendrobium nobile]